MTNHSLGLLSQVSVEQKRLLWVLLLASLGLAGGTCNVLQARLRNEHFLVPASSEEDCPILSGRGSSLDDGSVQMEVRAVYYVPRPIGVSSGEKDVYSDAFHRLHERDLELISKVLRANTLKLEPWDNKEDHTQFLKLCKRFGLFVIPAFDLKYFFTKKWLDKASTDREANIVKHFDQLLTSVRDEDPILAWTVNYAPLLNETIGSPAERAWELDPSPLRAIYFRIIGVLRSWHCRHDWNSTSLEFKRPLLLPVDLDSAIHPEDAAWYMAFAETYWGKFPVDHAVGFLNASDRNHLWGNLFDGWIGMTLPSSNEHGIQGAKTYIDIMKEPVGDTTSEKPAGSKDLFPKCLPEKAGCNHTSKKAKLLQFGFGALLNEVKNNKINLVPNKRMQATNLMAVWEKIRNSSDSMAGGVIDQWVDDWDRCGLDRGLKSQPFMHNKGGVCDDIRGAERRHFEWFGLSEQYDSFGSHCIDPRYLEGRGGSSHTVLFHFEGPKWFDLKTLRMGFCQRLQPSWTSVVLLVLVVVIIVTILCYRTAKICYSAKAHEVTDDEQLPRDEARGTLFRMRAFNFPSKSFASPAESYSPQPIPATGTQMPPLVKVHVQMKIPAQFGGRMSRLHSLVAQEVSTSSSCPNFGAIAFDSDRKRSSFRGAQENGIRSAQLELQVQNQNPRKGGLGSEQALFHLQAHHSAQARRLWHQVHCEALALQALGLDDQECLVQAMVNVHARVMEGYFVWLENRKIPNEDSHQRNKLDALLGQTSGEARLSWELWVEALLLRVLESLSEQGLHSPEFVAALYDQVRWQSGNNQVRLPETPIFELEYDKILSGVEGLKRNGNPYKGGVNFDDINDRGLEGRTDNLTKTYSEATSLWVLLDLLSNFQPVFQVKIWLFFLAWYVFLGQDDRNGYLWRPTFRRANSLQIFALLDCLLGCVMELLIIGHALQQWRFEIFCRGCKGAYGHGDAGRALHKRGRWLFRRMVTLLVCACGSVVISSQLHMQDIDDNLHKKDIPEIDGDYDNPDLCKALRVSSAVLLVRLLVFYLTTRPSSIPFIPGRPQQRKTAQKLPKLQPLTASAPLLRTEGSRQDRGAEDLASSQVEEHSDKQLKEDEVRLLRDFAWFIMLGACFFFEALYIVPLIADIHFESFCGDVCTVRAWSSIQLPIVGGFVSNGCIACTLALSLAWSLVILTAFFDVYYIFYAGTAIFGYAMGEFRGLRNVLSTTLRHLDLDSASTRHAPDLDPSDSADRQHDLAISDGEAMRQVFGVSWRMVWSKIVESLYREHVISSDHADSMVEAASTARWSTVVNKPTEDAFVSSQDAFTRLRFVATALRDGTRVEEAVLYGATRRCISKLEVHLHTDRSEKENSNSPEVCRSPLQDKCLVKSDFEDCTETKTLESEEQLQTLLSVLSADPGQQAVITTDMPGLERYSWLVAIDDVIYPHKIELIEALKDLRGKLPAELRLAKANAPFGEVLVDLDKPCRVKSLSFHTGQDKSNLDPVCWRVEGWIPKSDGGETGGVWKQMIWQDRPHRPPPQRKMSLHYVFDVEYWRLSTKAGSVHLQNFLPVVHERLSFFASSLRSLLKSGQKYAIRRGVDTLMDSHVGNIPSLSQVIPCYSETVILSKKFLHESDGVNTNLGFITSQFPEEWDLLCRRHGRSKEDLYKDFIANKPLPNGLGMEVRMWASMRSQTVSRTVVGAMQYQDVVNMLPSVRSSDDPAFALECCVELILAHQTYGSKKGSQESDADVRHLLFKYQDRAFYLVFDFDRENSRKSLVEAVKRFVWERHSFDRSFRYASVLARFRKGFKVDEDAEEAPPEACIEIVELLPRRFPLLVGTPGFMTQGKAGNQLGALRFSRGHYLQMMDANMGAFLGEACKVPFVLRRFQPHWSDRKTVRARILGFREFIFTESHGAVGSIMASAEWSFGTICQRFLAGLGARMHYGHPDFLDSFWASNRGSLSKASPAINLSEDIFAGFNVAMRGEASKHVDVLAWEKGRESSFNAASLFYTKVSSGNVGVMRSRDLKIITQNLNIVDNFSFFFASVGFYLNNLLIDISCVTYVRLFVLLSLSSKSLQDIGSLDSMLACEWTLSLGIIAMLPRFMELILEYGPLEGVLRFVPSIPGCMTMFTFINKSIASGVKDTMITGEADYIATGRPNANTHYSWKECYIIFCHTHYYPALTIYFCYTIYELVSLNHGYTVLPMSVLLISSAMWIVCPILYCPQPTLRTLSHDLNQFWQFAISTPEWSVRKLLTEAATTGGQKTAEANLRAGLKDTRSTLYEFWLLRELQHKKFPFIQRVGFFCCEVIGLIAVCGVLYSSLLDNMWLMVLLYAAHYALMEIWRVLYRPTVITLLTMLMWLLVPPLVFKMSALNLIFVSMVMVMFLSATQSLVQLIAWAVLQPKPINEWQEMSEATQSNRDVKKAELERIMKYDIVVEYLYVNLLGHQLHLYAAMIIMLVNLAVQFVLVLADMTYGVHSWALLNSRLRSQSLCQRRRAFEPKRSD